MISQPQLSGKPWAGHNPPKPPTLPTPTPTPPPPPALPVTLSDLVDKTYADNSADELATAPLHALKGISPTKAAALTQALGVHTIADLASNKYIRAAQTITAATT